MDHLRRLFGASPAHNPAPPPAADDEEREARKVVVENVQPESVRASLAAGEPITVIDIRESWEWSQAHLPPQEGRDIRHIPMNSLPSHTDELPRDRTIVVMCAHGNRSYSVTHWLRSQGYAAQNMEGGITRWAQRGGEVERGR